ncbi:MAG: hypothetical protein ABSH48_07540 [Verrucomicrobiota bacterium]|jgi:hypothetical protein
MKTFSGAENHDGGGGQKARGYLTTNIVMPGLGSLVGGRKVGLLQLGLSLGSFAMTVGCGIPFIYWSLAHWSEYHGANAAADPLKTLHDLWQHARWPLLGIVMFLFTWLWALLTSRSLLTESKAQPPVLKAVPDEK